MFSTKNSLFSRGHSGLIEFNVSESDNTFRLIMTVRTKGQKTELIFLPYKKITLLKNLQTCFAYRKPIVKYSRNQGTRESYPKSRLRKSPKILRMQPPLSACVQLRFTAA